MKKEAKKSSNKELNKQIGRRIRLRRLERSLSMEELDQMIGARKGTVRGLEAGERFIASGHVYALSQALNVEVTYFFEDAETDNSPERLSPGPEEVSGAQRLLKAYYGIEEPDLRRSVMELLKEVAEDESMTLPDS